MNALILFRSLTYGQRGKRVLERGGLYTALIKAPLGTEDGGCSYALRLKRNKLISALDLLRADGIPFGRVYEQDETGELRLLAL